MKLPSLSTFERKKKQKRRKLKSLFKKKNQFFTKKI